MGSLKITYTRSGIGQRAQHRATVRSLGLRKLNQTVILEDTPIVRGQVKAVRHLVTVEEVAE